MVMKPEPIFASVEAADPPRPLFLLGPGGRRFDQSMAHELAELAAPPGAGSACCAGATRASTTGSASTSSTAS